MVHATKDPSGPTTALSASSIVTGAAVSVIVSSTVGTLLSLLFASGVFGLPTGVPGWMSFLTVFKMTFGIPAEFFIAAVAALLINGKSASWRLACAAVLLGLTLGHALAFHRNASMWTMFVLSLLAAVMSAHNIDTSSQSLIRQTADDLQRAVRAPRSSTFLTVTFLLIVATWIKVYTLQHQNRTAGIEQLLTWYDSRSPRAVDGRATLTVFSDYQCPSCRVQVPQYLAIAAAMGPQVVVTIRDFPLDHSCNDNVPAEATVHPAACMAAVAARFIAREQPSRSGDFQRWLYSHQATMSSGLIRERLESMGVNLDALTASTPDLIAAVRADIQDAIKYGVYSTPSVVLNGVKLPGLQPAGLEGLLMRVLQRMQVPVVTGGSPNRSTSLRHYAAPPLLRMGE